MVKIYVKDRFVPYKTTKIQALDSKRDIDHLSNLKALTKIEKVVEET